MRNITSFLTLFLLLFVTSVFSQKKGDAVKVLKSYQDQSSNSPSTIQQIFRQEFHLTNGNELRLKSSKSDKEGYSHQRFQQYYNNIKVEFGEATIHTKANKINSVNGSVYQLEPFDLSPRISETVALERAKLFVGARKYLWEDPAQASVFSYEKPNGELVVVPAMEGIVEMPTLAYKFDIYAIEPLYRAFVYVDAKEGKIILENIILHHADVPASGESLYNGTVNFTADLTDGLFKLAQTGRGAGVFTYDLDGSTNYSNRKEVTSATSNFGLESATAVQAHWATERVYDYYFDVLGRNSYNDNGAQLISYTGYGTNYVNAFWNGSVMTYGDGDGFYRGPLVPLDIVGHEVTHGVTQFSANLIYQKESGALNESFSDIFGEVIEAHVLGTPDWLVGSEMGLNGFNGSFRSMANPKNYGDPNTYQGNNWINTDCIPSAGNDYCGVHSNSGVQNYWFYLLSQGGNGTNDIGSAYSVSGIGIEKAAQIAYRNLTLYLGSNSNFVDARLGAIQSAIDLYGEDSQELISVVNAWYAVGIGLDYGAECPETLISNDNNISFENPELVDGLDTAEGNQYVKNGGVCALEITNNDPDEPLAKYKLSINLLENETEDADQIYLSLDGKSGTGDARIEVVGDNDPNNVLFDHDFSDDWSTISTNLEVPAGLTTIDVWLFSNYNQQSSGNAFYDNLKIINVSNIAPFETTWQIDGDNRLDFYHSTSYNYDFVIDWGDGSIEQNVESGNLSHTYNEPGEYKISIRGNYPAIPFGNSSDRNRLLSVDAWGDIQWLTMDSAFQGCENVQLLTEDTPNLGNVSSLRDMFYNADAMNTDLSNWDFSAVTSMYNMFYDADAFNQDISQWNLGPGVDLGYLLYSADSFNQDLTGLDLSKITNLYRAFSYSGLSQENYDNTLISWATQANIPSNISLGAEGIAYCAGLDARQKLVDENGWAILDAGLSCPITVPFVTTWKTDNSGSTSNNQVRIFFDSLSDATVDWGDGTVEIGISETTTHTYPTAGTYQISISGIYPKILFDNYRTDRNKLISVDQWGDAKWQTMDSAFQNCQNVQILADDSPDLSNTTSLREMFYNADAMNEDLSGWDFSTITSMYNMFYDADSFDQDISQWNLGPSVDLSYILYNADSFNQNLAALDLSRITNLYRAFSYSGLSRENYDSALIGWAAQENIPSSISLGVEGVVYCEGDSGRSILVDDYGWNILDAGIACPITLPFVTTWKTDNQGSTSDNQVRIFFDNLSDAIIDWGDGNVDTGVKETITHSYAVAGTYQIKISGVYPRITFYNSSTDRNKLLSVDQWGDSQWQTMDSAFENCQSVQILAEDTPNLSNVSSLHEMFRNADRMNEDLSSWDFSAVTTMYNMFYDADGFNQNIGQWSLGSNVNLGYMLYSADSFDQSLAELDLSKISNLYRTFSYSGLSQENYDTSLIAWSEKENIPSNVSVGVEGTAYCAGEEARLKLINDYGWYFNDSGLACANSVPFITTWKTDNPGTSDNNQVTFPIEAPSDVVIDWGDGTIETGIKQARTHTYAQPGTYQISLIGIYPKISFGSANGFGDRSKLISVDQWGDNQWQDLNSSFQNCENVQILAEDTPDLGNLTSLNNMFYNADRMNEDISNWDFSTIARMSNMFYDADEFDQNISQWNFGSNVDLGYMFYNADSFNQNLSALDLSKISNLYRAFSNSGLSQENYDATLIGWAAQETIPSNTSLGAEGTAYCLSADARQKLVGDYNWNISDSGLACASTVAFITTWKTDNRGSSGDNQVIFPIDSPAEVTIDWGDGTIESGINKTAIHTYTEVGTYQISVTGIYPRISFGSANNFGDHNKLIAVNQWGDSQWQSMDSAFQNCQNVQIWAEDSPDLTKTVSLRDMFYNADSMNADLSGWDFSTITTMNNMFYDADGFNQNVSQWNFGSNVDLRSMFYNADSFDQDLGALNLSKIVNLNGIFSNSGLSQENYDNTLIGWSTQENIPSNISIGAVGTTYCLGADARQELIENYNWNISDSGLACINTIAFVTTWKTDNPGSSANNQITIPIEEPSNVRIDWGDGSFNTNVAEIITHTYAETGTYQISITGIYPRINFGSSYYFGDRDKLISVDQWGDSQWSTMDSAFQNCRNVQILAEDVPDLRKVTSMREMFYNADAMNQDLSGWDFSNILIMSSMFYNADSFDQDISQWNFGSSVDLAYMFYNAKGFNQNLGELDLSKINNLYRAFSYSGLSQENYDNSLMGWAAQDGVPSNISLGANDITFCKGAEARQMLIDDYNWYILDGGEDPNCGNRPFVTTWKTDNAGESEDNQITIPTFPGETYNYSVDWGDGTTSENVTGDITRTYDSPGTYTVSITGDFPRIFFDGQATNFRKDFGKIISIDQWGDIEWSSMAGAFNTCPNLSMDADDVPNLKSVTDFNGMFVSCNLKDNPSFNEWDVSSATIMSGMFLAANFNSDIGNWDVSNVVQMGAMFHLSTFNSDISNWDVGQVEVMSNMFSSTPFNQDLSNWDVTSVQRMGTMFNRSGLSDDNYNKTLIGWSQLASLQNGVKLDAPQNHYCQAKEERQFIIDTYGWIINDAGAETEPPLAVCKDITLELDENGLARLVPADINDESSDNCGISSIQVSPSSFTIEDLGENAVTFTVEDVNGNTSSCQAIVTVVDSVSSDCPDFLINEEELIALPAGSGFLGVDGVVGTSEVTNDSDCALVLINNDVNEPFANYRIPIDLAAYGINAGDELFISLDGNSTEGNARIEVLRDNAPNNAVFSETYIGGWSTISETVIVPEGITSLDIWLYSNYLSNEPGTAYYDNLIVKKLGGEIQRPFITTWKTDNPGFSEDNQITIPTFLGATYDYTVDWGDGTTSENVVGDITHSYNSPGTYAVSISGVFPRIYFRNSNTDKRKFLTVEQWGDILWNSMEEAFFGSDPNITAVDAPNLTNVTSLKGMFSSCPQLRNDNQSMNTWDVSGIEDMSSMFQLSAIIGIQIPDWDVSNVRNMSSMFVFGSIGFDITNWDVGNVTNMASMFLGCPVNQSLENWDVRKVTNMRSMFDDSAMTDDNYNKTLIGWSQLSTLQTGVQLDAPQNQYCEAKEARQFIIDTYGWTINDAGELDGCGIVDCPDFLINEEESIVLPAGSGFLGIDEVLGTSEMTNGSECALALTNNSVGQPFANYRIPIELATYGINAGDELFISLDGNSTEGNARIEVLRENTPNNAVFSETYIGGWSTISGTVIVPQGITSLDIWLYSNYLSNEPGTAYYDNLIVRKVGEEIQRPFITTWKTDNPGASEDNQITIPTFPGETYNYTVDWGDGTTSENIIGDITHSYDVAGTYSVAISGDFPRIFFNPGGDNGKILSVEQWGTINWSSMAFAFNSTGVDILATDSPNMSLVTSMQNMFSNCSNLKNENGSMANWDVSNINNMRSLFPGSSFNTDISNWDVGNVTDMSVMFSSSPFNKPIDDWDVSNVESMFLMFAFSEFNQAIGGWDVSSVTNMQGLFYSNPDFNQPIGNWDVRQVTTMHEMFEMATEFDQSLENWVISNVVDMTEMLEDSGLSNENYESTLIGWSQLSSLQSGVQLDAPQNQYCEAKEERQFIIDTYGWTINDAGELDGCGIVDCPERLQNEDESIVLPDGAGFLGIDEAIGTSEVTNGSDCAFVLVNNDGGEPFANYRIPVDLASYSINPGDNLFISLDGNNSEGIARIEVLRDNTPNNAIFSETYFGNDWSTISQTIVVPEDITSLDIWLYSNYLSNEPGTAYYDNLVVRNLGPVLPPAVPFLANTLTLYPNPTSESVNMAFDQPTEIIEFQIFDLLGRLIRTVKVDKKDREYQMQVSDLQSGTYIIQTMDTNGQLYDEQLVIER